MSDKPRIKVAIIGGGPSGWSAAEALRDERWSDRFDITLYEKNSYFGGKCSTVFPDGSPCNGQPGGYELGAGVVSKGSQSNADLEALLQRYGIPYSNAAESGRIKYRLFVKGRALDAKTIAAQLLRNPLQFVSGAYGLIKYLIDLRRYSPTPQIEFQGRPKPLNKNLSEKYPHEFNLCCGFGMQGFGYAHMDDKDLTPPMLYYHQYATTDVLVNPVYTIDIGMQGIWAKVASTYEDDKARLNEAVVTVRRESNGVTVETAKSTELYDYLIVAVPLGPNLNFMDFRDEESSLLAKVKNNHYVTVLCRVSGLTDIGNINILKTVDRDAIGEIVFAYKRYPDSDWVSINLYIDPKHEKTDEEILDAVEKSLKDDYAAKMIQRSAASIYHWHDYFPHLNTADLNDNWYQKFEDNVQGKHRTLYVSSGLHMETVGASVQYATEKVKQQAHQWLSENH